MRYRVEAAHCEAAAGEQKLAERRILGHPGDTQGVLRGEIECSVHRKADGTAGGEYSHPLVGPTASKKVRQSRVNSRRKIAPRLDAGRRNFPFHPPDDNRLKEFLEGFATSLRFAGGLKRGG